MSSQHTPGPIVPTYYVRHPDGSYTIAEPQPSIEQIAAQCTEYGQCDRVHGGAVCDDPDCYRAARTTKLRSVVDDLVAAARLAVAVIDEETEIVIRSNTGPGGVISDPEARKTLDKYDEAINALNAAIAKATGAAS